MATELHRLAVLVDADNASAAVVKELLEEVAKYGTATVKRAYGDWTTTNLTGWKEVLHRHAIQPVQQFAYARFVPPDSREPGARTIAAYAAEWERLAELLAENADLVTPEDIADESTPDEDETDDVDPMDRLDRQ